MDKEECHGDCDYEDADNGPPREFIIRVSTTLPLHKLLVTITHELVHLKQYYKGELKNYIRTNDIKWKGEKLTEKQVFKMDYWLEPWEIEAYGLQRALAMKFIEKNQHYSELLHNLKYDV